jgi:hypothetical protein
VKRLTILLVAALLLSACGGSKHYVVTGGPAFVRLTPPSPTALRFSTASNRRFAHQDVQRLMRILVLPHGARLVAKVPRGVPLRFGTELTGRQFLRGIAVAHRIWVVHQPLDRVVRFVQAHAHPRPRPLAHYRGKNNGVRFRAVGSYQFQPVPGRSWERWLNVGMIALSGGRTAVIAQTGDGWNHTPQRVLLPAAVKRIDVVSRIGNRPPNVLVHVRKPYEVGSIVALVNGLGLSDAEHIACALDFVGGPSVTMRFRAANGKLLARATVPDTPGAGISGPCNPLQLTVHSQKAPPLIGADLLLRIRQLLNIDLAPPRPQAVSACLQRRHGWKVQSGIHTGMAGRVQHFPPELTATKGGRRWTITFHYSGKVTLSKAAPRGLEHCLQAGQRYVIAG